jgi:hypothetical protein
MFNMCLIFLSQKFIMQLLDSALFGSFLFFTLRSIRRSRKQSADQRQTENKKKRYSTCIVCRGDRKFPLFRGKKTGHGIPPLSCSPFITHLLTPQHRSAAKLYRSNQNSCPSSFSFSFLGNAASNFSKASGFLSQIKLQRQLHGRFIRIRQLTKNHRHIFQWSARQIIMMKLRKF